MSAPNSIPPAQGVEILTIPSAIATQEYLGETVGLGAGELKLLLVSIELNDGDGAGNQPDHSTDLWLVLSIGGDFSLPIAATQTILPQRNPSHNAYILPSVELEGASIKIALPSSTSSAHVSRFQQILSQYAAYQDDDRTDAGKMELMDQDGNVIGVVQGNFTVHEAEAMSDSGNEKAPVLIDLPPEPISDGDNQHLQVDVVPSDESQGWMIRGADLVSRTIIKTSEYVGAKMQGAADSYISKTPAAGSSNLSTSNNEKADDAASRSGRDPIKVGSKTQASVRTLHNWSGSAVQVSSKTTGAILRVAGGIGDKIGKKTGIQRKVNPDGTYGPPPKGIRGFVNRSLIAANTVLDSVDQGAQTLLYSGSDAASKVVGHKYGDDARQVANGIGRTGKNVFIVYKDLRGVRRSALLKAARSRVMKAKLEDGRELTVHVDEKGTAIASSISSSPTSNSKPNPTTINEKSSYTRASSNPPSYSNTSTTSNIQPSS